MIQRLKSNFWIGSAVALLSALAFSYSIVLAGVSYQFGANIHALNLARGAAFLTFLLLLVVARRSSFAMPAQARLSCILVGLLLTLEMYLLLGAIQTIPVGLAILILYTYPLLLAVYGWIRKTQRFTWLALLLLLLIFCGLVIVLIDAPVELDTAGVTLAIGSAFTLAALLAVSEHSLDRYDNSVVMVHALLVVMAIVGGLSLTMVDLHWPENEIGWLNFGGSTIFYVVATYCLFRAVNLVGPLQTAVIDNTSPVWAMLFGFLLLQELLTRQQLLGASLVIGSVMLMQWSQSRQLKLQPGRQV